MDNQTPLGLPNPASSVTPGVESWQTLVRLGTHALDRGDEAAAIALFRRAHGVDPDEIDPLLRLGGTLAQVGAHFEAEGAFRTALDLRPTNDEALRGLANALIVQRQPAEALAVLQQGGAGGALVQNTRGVALDMLGRHADATLAYLDALSARGGDLDIRSNLALSRALVGSAEEATTTMRAVAAAPMATPRHRQNLIIVLGLVGDDAGARAAAQRFGASGEEVARAMAHIERLRGIDDTGLRATEILLGGS